MNKKTTYLARLTGILLCTFMLLGGAERAFSEDAFYVLPITGNSADLTTLKSDVATLQSQVAVLQGKIFPMGLINMYDDSRVRITLTGESKTITDIVNHKVKVALRLLITNKTANTIYLGYEWYSSSVADENGMTQTRIDLAGINGVYSTTSDGNSFSAIGPNSSITATWTSNENSIFYNSHYLTSSFGFVLFGNTANTRFNAGFTGISLPN